MISDYNIKYSLWSKKRIKKITKKSGKAFEFFL